MRTARLGGAPSSPGDTGRWLPNADVAALCAYLAVPTGRFAAQQDGYFRRLGQLLEFHGAVASAADVGPDTFRDAVVRFQRDQGLPVDGIPGEETAWALNLDWAPTRALPLIDVEAGRCTQAAARRAHDGQRHEHRPWQVRSDAATAVAALRAELDAAGVPATPVCGTRPLTARLPPDRPATSIHYSGVAIDLAVVSGGFPDVTAVARRHGFVTAGPRHRQHAGAVGGQWWHLQYDKVFVPWISQFGSEILAIAGYSVSDLEAQPRLWENRKRLFQRGRDGWW